MFSPYNTLARFVRRHADDIEVLFEQVLLVDNESAKMTTGKGTIQGYNGAAAVDKKHQIIINVWWRQTPNIGSVDRPVK